MSWFQRGAAVRTSGARRNASPSPSPSPPKELDANACFESFKMHWQQASESMSKSWSSSASRADCVRSVLSHTDQMVTLLLHDVRVAGNSIGPLLDHLLTENVLDQLYEWSESSGDYTNALRLEQLKLYETLITHSYQELLVHKPILQPLLRLLSSCGEGGAPVELEKRLVILLNQICVSLSQNETLLDFFCSVSSQLGPSRFLIFSLLIPFVHREGAIGQQTRDALLLCMSLTQKNDSIGLYIAERSNFCPILATGLSGLYSLLPRKLIIEAEDWHRLTIDDVHDLPELSHFMNSFEFCNAVVQASYPLIQEQLLEYIYQGFLSPVMGPALHQSSVDENIAATAYLDLFIRQITEPALLQSFIKFIFTDVYEGSCIIDSLITRIGNQSRLCLVTLAIFRTLMELNCEDVMLRLIFRYLNPCTHVMVSQRARVRDLDLYCKTAEKFLSLLPACCHPEVELNNDSSNHPSLPTSESVPSNLMHHHHHHRSATVNGDFRQMERNDDELAQSDLLDYLLEARRNVRACRLACRNWTSSYDGSSTLSESKFNVKKAPKVAANMENGVKTSEFKTTRTDLESKWNRRDVNEKNVESREANFAEKPFADAAAIVNAAIQSSDDQHFWNLIDGWKNPILDDSLENICNELDAAAEQFVTKNRNWSQQTPIAIITNFHGFEEPCSVSTSFSQETVDADDQTGLDQWLTKPNSPLPAPNINDNFGNPDTGPFLSVLFNKLENMMQNNLYINLQLTGLITRLACYPQPLLRSFLLNHTLVFQPTVRSLLQVLGSLKHKLDSYSNTVDNFSNLLQRARKFLKARENRLKIEMDPPIQYLRCRSNSSPDNRNKAENRRRSITDFLFRKQTDRNAGKGIYLEGIPNGTGYRYINRPFPDAPDGKLESLKTKNAVLCAVVLQEFLTELAAVTQEHAVAELDSSFKFFGDKLIDT